MGLVIPQNPLQALYDALRLTRDANYSLAAAVTFLVFDIFMTLSDEVKYIWGSRWSFPKFLYLMGRYYGLIYLVIRLGVETHSNLSVPVCKAYYWYYVMGGDILFTTIVNVIFVLRIYALYGRSRKVLLVFVVLCLGCLTNPQPRKPTLISWVPCICVAWAFFLASLLRLRNSFRSARVLRGAMSGEQKPTLVMTLIRDGTIYFCLILSILVVCTSLTVTNSGNGQLYTMASPWLIVVYSFSATQLILNLRRASAPELEFTAGSILRPKVSGGPIFAHSAVNGNTGIAVETSAPLPDDMEMSRPSSQWSPQKSEGIVT
ncbi:hypothetical protein GALMADRAFT_284123 [Galerina marginata CBS 339.88]|uniref:DUF6533 domain-containing protein n=1 Tax=Galerina marginata (strain CBS 339.88) TaxID=685588 RepID=A0A067SDD0_GALM3|nr:hypothetical protein GALMADRAFT_284123 [Galerina marginata CBS 339.88]